MSSSDEIWILGIHMTKFGKHPDKDTVDLGAEAILGALTKVGLAHVIGLGSACGIHILERSRLAA